MVLITMGSVGLVPIIAGRANGADLKKADAYALEIVRGGGLIPPGAPNAELSHWRFTVAKDGSWEFRFGVFGKGGVKKGKLSADELRRWIKDIEDGGFHKLVSNPRLGGADDSYMDISIRVKEEKTRKRISFAEKLSQAVHKRVFELAKPEK